MEQLVDVPFENITVKIPCGYDAILTRCYGDYMKLPDEKDRVNHMLRDSVSGRRGNDIWKMKIKDPIRVSVIVPVYNRGRLSSHMPGFNFTAVP